MRKHTAKRSGYIFLAFILSFGSFIGMSEFDQPASAITGTSVDYTYVGNVGNVVSTWSQNGDLVNPTMVSYADGTSNIVYVYCDSTDMPYATGGLISDQASPANWRTVVIFHDNGDGTFTYQSMVTIEIAGSGFSFNGSKPQGMTVDANHVIYMTAPTNALVAVYQSNPATPITATPTFIGPTSASDGYTGSVLGVPSIDQTNGAIIVGGTFNGGSPLGYASYGVAKIDPTSPTASTDIPALFIPYNSGGNTYYVENVVVSPSGNHLAAGYFQINGSTFNIIHVDLTSGAITPIAPANVAGLNNTQESASIYGMNSINSDNNGNIYLSGNFGINNNGQYQASSLLKLDQNGNFVTDIAPQTNTTTTTGQINGLNMVSINTASQCVFVVDTANSAGAAVRVFNFNGSSGTNITPPPSSPVGSINLDPDTGTVFVTPPDEGGNTTITNQSQASCNNNQPPSTVININTSDMSNGIPINTTVTNPSTGQFAVTSFVVFTNGNVTLAMTTQDDNYTTDATGTPVTNSDGSTTTTINLTAPDGTTLTNTINIATNPEGGKTIHSTKTITDTNGYSSSTLIIISTDSAGDINISVTLPNITIGNNYCTTVTTNNGSGATTPIIIPWTAGSSSSTITLNEAYCSSIPFSISILPTAAGTLGTDCATITTITDNPTGYNTTLNTSSAYLTCSTGSGTYSLTPASSTLAALSNNQWGYYIGYNAPSTFQAVPTTSTIIQSNTGATSGDQFKFWIGSQLDLSQPSCIYTGEIVITASAEPLPAPTITSISPTSGSINGGDVITITGTNFGTSNSPYISQIAVGGISCTFIAVINNTTATCTTPALAAGTYDVAIDGFGGSATLPSSWSAS